MTTLAARPVSNPDELALFADPWTSLAKPFADAFHDATLADALAHDGEVDPNRVRLALLDHDGFNPRQLSALWCTACAADGWLDKTDVTVPIAGEGSRGNGNKSVRLRRLRAYRKAS